MLSKGDLSANAIQAIKLRRSEKHILQNVVRFAVAQRDSVQDRARQSELDDIMTMPRTSGQSGDAATEQMFERRDHSDDDTQEYCDSDLRESFDIDPKVWVRSRCAGGARAVNVKNGLECDAECCFKKLHVVDEMVARGNNEDSSCGDDLKLGEKHTDLENINGTINRGSNGTEGFGEIGTTDSVDRMSADPSQLEHSDAGMVEQSGTA